jgi:hypothetical protein
LRLKIAKPKKIWPHKENVQKRALFLLTLTTHPSAPESCLKESRLINNFRTMKLGDEI